VSAQAPDSHIVTAAQHLNASIIGVQGMDGHIFALAVDCSPVSGFHSAFGFYCRYASYQEKLGQRARAPFSPGLILNAHDGDKCRSGSCRVIYDEILADPSVLLVLDSPLTISKPGPRSREMVFSVTVKNFDSRAVQGRARQARRRITGTSALKGFILLLQDTEWWARYLCFEDA